MKKSVKNRVLTVDLDGTLIKSDVLYEGIAYIIAHFPWYILLLPFWLLKGRAYLKHKVAEKAVVDPALLPYNLEFLSFLKEEKKKGRYLVLITATDEKLAQPVADYLGIFDEVYASQGKINLKGKNKSKLLIQKYGEGGFDYAGNSVADFPVWEDSFHSVVVTPSKKFLKDCQAKFAVSHSFLHETPRIKTFLRTIRVHQWVKNLLIFIPAIMAHRLHEGEVLQGTLIAFVAFSLAASSVYLLNDVIDLQADRVHKTKRFRPFAAGDVSLGIGMLLVPFFLLLAFIFAAALPGSFILILALYFLLTLLYSLYLKQIVILDILILAGLYTVRLFAGGLAVGVAVSTWLMAFSMFFFLSLACVKRFSELFSLGEFKDSSPADHVAGRGYFPSDLDQVARFGSSSGYISVLVLALYISSSDVVQLYSHPEVIWLLCAVLLYWISRVWLLAHRGQLHEDPIVFALQDRISYVLGGLAAIILFLGV